MKKFKICLAIAIAAIATVAASFYSYNAAQENFLAQEQELLFLEENWEALTQSESIDTFPWGILSNGIPGLFLHVEKKDCWYTPRTEYAVIGGRPTPVRGEKIDCSWTNNFEMCFEEPCRPKN